MILSLFMKPNHYKYNEDTVFHELLKITKLIKFGIFAIPTFTDRPPIDNKIRLGRWSSVCVTGGFLDFI